MIDCLRREKTVTLETLGDLLVSLFLACLGGDLGGLDVLKMRNSLLSSTRHCLAALALSRITSKGRDLGVELEVEGRVSGDSSVKAG